MSTESDLQARSDSKCELCGASDGLSVYEVPPRSDGEPDHCLLICPTCSGQIDAPDTMDARHWRCLGDSMWAPVPAVQVMAWRILTLLGDDAWAQSQLDMLYLEDDVLAWAQAMSDGDADDAEIKHLDSNGAVLSAGDTVTLIKDLNVKGANFTAKRGTAVRGISLVQDNAKQIEGRVSGQQIVILTEFVKKSV